MLERAGAGRISTRAGRHWRLMRPLVVLACCVVTLSVQAQQVSVEQLGQDVERLFRAGKHADGIALADKALALAESSLGPDHPEVGHALHRLGVLHRAQGRLDVAEQFARRALTVMEKARGPRHADVAKAIGGLASVARARGDMAGAQALDHRALEIYENALGREHPDVAIALNNLGGSYFSQGKYDVAEPLWRRALAIRTKAFGETHAEVGQSLYQLGIVRWLRADRADAETFLLRAMKVEADTIGTEHPSHARTMVTLAGVYREMGREAEAEAMHRSGLAIQEKALGTFHPLVAETLVNLGNVYFTQARYALAEPAYQRALAIFEKANLAEHPYAGSALANLSAAYLEQGRLLESEPLLVRGMAIMEKRLGSEHPDIAHLRKNLAVMRLAQGRGADAEALLRGSLAIYEKSGTEQAPNAMLALDELGRLLAAVGRAGEAQEVLEQALARRAKSLGPEHPDVGRSLVSLGDLDARRGALDSAAERFQRSLVIRERALGSDHPSVAESLDRLVAIDAAQGRTTEALLGARRATAILARRFSQTSGRAAVGLRSEQRLLAQRFATHVSLLERIRVSDDGGELHEALRVAQLARASDTAAQLAQMAARHASRDDGLAALVRTRQDEESALARAETELLDELARPRDPGSLERIAQLRSKQAQKELRIAEVDTALLRDFPRYRELIDPTPVEVAEVQALLGTGEALASYLVADDAAYVWVITKNAAVLRRLNTDRKRLEQAVRTMRRALEPAGDPAAVLRWRFPFDVARALYRDLLAPVQGSLAGVRHLIVVADGPLQSLPFGVLVTDAPRETRNEELAQAAWLIKRVAISVLPAESSLRALRAFAVVAPGRESFGGFGDPLLEGPPGQRGSFTAALRSRGSVADVREVRKLARLPDTADELQAIAASLKARPDAVFLREKATESRVKSADLRSYRTLAFATHGLLAGDLQGLAEPALVLTPPAQGDTTDDGLLTASEIAQLRLNADWVILSACNTAGDDGTPGAEGLSGLAKAFFYSGARSLLVSHWAVSSDATVRLTTGMLRHHVAGRSKAEALQRSMLDLMQRKGRLPYAHPMFWAPFVVVGEGNPAWRGPAAR